MSENKANSFAIVLCCTADWLPFTAATLLSCVQHGAAEIADLFVMVLGACAKDHQIYHEFTNAHGFHVVLIDGVMPPLVDNYPFDRYSKASVLRLTLDKLLPAKYTRVLYLDSDIIAEGPIADILTVDLKNKSMGAVEDYQSLPHPFNRFSSYAEKLGLGKGTPYFNSGVMLFDWHKTREKGFLQRGLDRIAAALQQGHSFKLPDQDVLNLEFVGEWQRLDLRFNLMAFFVDYFPMKPVFRHFSNRQKPWGAYWQPGFSQARAFYRETFLNSPWPTFAPRPYQGLSLEGTGGVILRKLNPFAARRYRAHLERP